LTGADQKLIDQINQRLLGLRLQGRPIDFGLLANGSPDRPLPLRDGQQPHRQGGRGAAHLDQARFTSS
jgi:hypothetical protein